MLFCLLEYLQMLEHMENIWEKNASLFLTMKEGERASFSLLTLRVWGEQGTFSVSFEEIFSSQGC